MAELTLDALHRLMVEILVAHNTSASVAEQVAAALTLAEADGQKGHGASRVPSYAGQALSGKVDGHAMPKAETTRPGAMLVDAAHGFAYPALALAMEWLPDAARAQGIAVAGITRSHHAGVAGWFVERLAEAGLVGLMFANTPAAMAPWGGTRPLFGTNPIAFAAPVPGGDPMVVDLHQELPEELGLQVGGVDERRIGHDKERERRKRRERPVYRRATGSRRSVDSGCPPPIGERARSSRSSLLVSAT